MVFAQFFHWTWIDILLPECSDVSNYIPVIHTINELSIAIYIVPASHGWSLFQSWETSAPSLGLLPQWMKAPQIYQDLRTKIQVKWREHLELYDDSWWFTRMDEVKNHTSFEQPYFLVVLYTSCCHGLWNHDIQQHQYLYLQMVPYPWIRRSIHMLWPSQT